MLAGCGGSQPPIGAPGAMPQTSAITPAQAAPRRVLPSSSSYRLLYRFPGSANNGYDPQSGLIDVNGTLYGTTVSGGKYDNGTAYSITTSGDEQVLHDFGNVSDGSNPAAGLTNVNGTFYGTTPHGAPPRA
jgi:uncharacterized repeat protein (TIGR03803 family)